MRSATSAYHLPLAYYRGVSNIGDIMSPVIVEAASGFKISSGQTRQGTLLSLGSILQGAKANHYIWGSGIKQPDFALPPPVLSENIFAVRGKLTADLLTRNGMRLADIALGDPGLLIADIIKHDGIRVNGRIGVVPHHGDKNKPAFLRLCRDERVKLIDVHGSKTEFFRDFLSCEIIISSSLHGLVFADAFGIPNIWVIPESKPAEWNFKFNDYYSVTDQIKTPMILNEASVIDHLLPEATVSAYLYKTTDLVDSFDIGRLFRDGVIGKCPADFVDLQSARANRPVVFVQTDTDAEADTQYPIVKVRLDNQAGINDLKGLSHGVANYFRSWAERPHYSLYLGSQQDAASLERYSQISGYFMDRLPTDVIRIVPGLIPCHADVQTLQAVRDENTVFADEDIITCKNGLLPSALSRMQIYRLEYKRNRKPAGAGV